MEHLSNNNNSKDLRLGFSARRLSKTKTTIMVSARIGTPKETTFKVTTISAAVVTKTAALNSRLSLSARARWLQEVLVQGPLEVGALLEPKRSSRTQWRELVGSEQQLWAIMAASKDLNKDIDKSFRYSRIMDRHPVALAPMPLLSRRVLQAYSQVLALLNPLRNLFSNNSAAPQVKD